MSGHNSALAQRHWNGVKQIFWYLRGTIDMSLFYSKEWKVELVGYVGYHSNPYKGRS